MREQVRVFDATTTWAQFETPMAQFGNVEVLSNILFDKKVNTKAFFYQSNGGLKRVEN